MPSKSHLARQSVINLFYHTGLCKRMCWALIYEQSNITDCIKPLSRALPTWGGYSQQSTCAVWYLMQLYYSLYLFRKYKSNVQWTWILFKNSWITHKFFSYWYSLCATQITAYFYGLNQAISMVLGENVLALELQKHYTLTYPIPAV